MKGNILAGIISVVMLIVTIRAIRKKQLTEMHAILWLGVSLGTALLSTLLPFGAFTPLAHFFGIAYPPDMVLVFGLFFFALFTFQLSVSMSRLSARQKVLVQELALVKEMLDPESAQ
ncbi:MAG: DUF2304 domain-containing protein [Acidimicrobiaceae bacterium]|nr:DUF2304 domain-containing protein [Acidimicrobiaceae bacterium]